MNKQEYNNVIEATVAQQTGKKDSLETTREMLNNMGVVLPQGDLKQVSEGLATDDYMGWRKCTVKEAQEYANEGTAVVAVSEDKIALVAANEDEGKVAANSSAVMTLDENTPALALADMAFYVNSRAGTTMPINDRVTIWYDGYLKVRFHSSGKVWHYIGYDLINGTNIPLQLFDRSKYNFFVDGDFGPVKTYSDKELKFLYAIDPYGVSEYIRRYSEKMATGSTDATWLRNVLLYKDHYYEVFFGNEPKYYKLDGNNQWVIATDTEQAFEEGKVFSLSEAVFGMHSYGFGELWDAFVEFIKALGEIALSLYFQKNAKFEKLQKCCSLFVLLLSVVSGNGVEGLLGLSSYMFNYYLDKHNIDWIFDVAEVLSSFNSVVSLHNYSNLTNEFTLKTIEACAYRSEFDVEIMSQAGNYFSLKEVYTALSQ